MDEHLDIHWYPGHMAKARRMIEDNLKLVDAVCEVIDARIPLSSRNPDIDAICGTKPRLVVLNKADLADPGATVRWKTFFKDRGAMVLETDCKTGKGVGNFSGAVRSLLSEKLARYAAKGQAGRPLRVMVLGIPNVGKSAFINRVAKRKAAIAADRPGVTRGKQWISVDERLELLDTPGILWPRFDSRTVGLNLAITGAVKDNILDTEGLAAQLFSILQRRYPQNLAERYKLEEAQEDSGYDLLEKAARKRGFLLRGGEVDTLRMANILLDEFRAGKVGRMTLELPGEETVHGDG